MGGMWQAQSAAIMETCDSMIKLVIVQFFYKFYCFHHDIQAGVSKLFTAPPREISLTPQVTRCNQVVA